jgi:acyl-CoA dehydrogenase
LFFEDVKLPAEGLLGPREGEGFIQLMQELPQERLIVATGAIGMIERALALTIDYVKTRQAFGKKIIEFQNTQFVLAECKSEATIGRCSTTIASSATSGANSTPRPPRWRNIG